MFLNRVYFFLSPIHLFKYHHTIKRIWIIDSVLLCFGSRHKATISTLQKPYFYSDRIQACFHLETRLLIVSLNTSCPARNELVPRLTINTASLQYIVIRHRYNYHTRMTWALKKRLANSSSVFPPLCPFSSSLQQKLRSSLLARPLLSHAPLLLSRPDVTRLDVSSAKKQTKTIFIFYTKNIF